MVLAIDRERGFNLAVFGDKNDARLAVVSGDPIGMVTSHARIEAFRIDDVAIIDPKEVVVMDAVVHSLSLFLKSIAGVHTHHGVAVYAHTVGVGSSGVQVTSF